MQLNNHDVIAHIVWTYSGFSLHLGAPEAALFDSKRDLKILVRASVNEAELEALGRFGRYDLDQGSRFFTVNTVGNLTDRRAAEIWAALSQKQHYADLVLFKGPLDSFLLMNDRASMRAFAVDLDVKYVRHLVEIDLGADRPVETGADIAEYFFNEVNPTLGALEILHPDVCENYVAGARQLQPAWDKDARDLFFAAMGKEIDTIIDKEGKLLADATHAIFNMLVDGDSTTVSDPTTWTFQGTRQYILLKEFGQKLKAELEPKLSDLLRRFGPTEETLVPRQDSRTRCFRKDWQPGGRYTVTFVPLHRATAYASTASS